MHITPSVYSVFMSNLDPHKTCVSDGIPVISLDKRAPKIADVLSKLYNKSFATFCFISC